jgi:hypothetical protein
VTVTWFFCLSMSRLRSSCFGGSWTPLLNVSPGKDRCFLLRCYRKPAKPVATAPWSRQFWAMGLDLVVVASGISGA